MLFTMDGRKLPRAALASLTVAALERFLRAFLVDVAEVILAT